MKKTYLSICLMFGLGIGSLHAGNGNEWSIVPSSQIPASFTQNVFPTTFSTFKLDINTMRTQLSAAGTTPATGVKISIPVNGAVQELLVWKDNVMAEGLRAKFPEIENFTAVDPHNHAISAKLDLNPYGFFAMVFNPEIGTFVIDPYSLHSDEFYISYFRKDMDLDVYKPGLCSTKDPNMVTLNNLDNAIREPNIHASSEADIRLMRSNGSIKRTYRCAISCTGEWANMITGGTPTVVSVMSMITSVMNRSNGVFQRELSVKMELITENAEVVYLDPASDPYTCVGEAHDCLIDQVQTAMNAKFPGGTNYDIGHIFCTTGGGLAQLNSVCNVGNHARGVSGVFSASDIGTVIHEMGHQLGTGHTFNSNAGGCSGNGMEESAYEPGSGSSIMSYNGACDPDNVTASEFEYYHVASLEMITNNIALGSGATCGTTVLGYTPITVMNLGQNYKIPRNTPFELIAEESETSEPAPPSVTYSWEQWDLGSFSEDEESGGGRDSGPIFESRAPVAKRDRQFPDNQLVAAGTYSAVGQRLPMVARTLNFKLTARSFFEAWGTFNYTENTVKIDVVECPQFRVTAPNVTALYEVGAPITIKWDTTLTRQAPISCGFVNIYMSLNGGLTFPYVVATSVANMGSYDLAAPDAYSDNIRFKVKGAGNIFYDISKTSVRIHGEHLGIDPSFDIAKDLKIYPNPASNMLYLRNETMLQTPYNISMYNIAGQQVYEANLTQNLDIDVSQFAKGIYMMHVWDSIKGIGKTEKIVVK